MAAYLNAVMEANPESMQEVNRTMSEALRKVLTDIGLIDSIKQESALAMLEDKLPYEKIARYTGLSLEEIQALQARP